MSQLATIAPSNYLNDYVLEVDLEYFILPIHRNVLSLM